MLRVLRFARENGSWKVWVALPMLLCMEVCMFGGCFKFHNSEVMFESKDVWILCHMFLLQLREIHLPCLAPTRKVSRIRWSGLCDCDVN